MALVITLILLAVITTLAVAFLALTSRETGAVDAMGRTTDSELAAQSALERAKAQVVAPFPFNNQGNDFGSQTMGPDLTVSAAWETNRVDFATTGFNELTNLLRDPSPPVFVDTNRAGTTGPGEDRFYLDLNRNRYFEESGHVQVTDDNFRGLADQTNWVVGDPQWIGILQDPSRPHGPDNRFIARYAFLIQPIGRSLDVNWIHNDAKYPDAEPVVVGTSGYFRNQGVGTYELNLAGFLTDLNANYWDPLTAPAYAYNTNANSTVGLIASRGAAFQDALQFLRFRYRNDKLNLASLGSLVFNPAGDDFVDTYADGLVGPTDNVTDNDNPTLPWFGADSSRHFNSLHDFFDGSKLPDPLGFTNKLSLASARGNTYDRYTYYRMLAQLGTDSEAEDEGKININYVNIRSWVRNSNYRLTSRDMVSWTTSTPQFITDMGRPGPELFFLTVVTNLFLREPALAFVVTNSEPGIPLKIPVFTNGISSASGTNPPIPGPLYSGRLHQILQQAANIFDATTGSEGNPPTYFPSVFRPWFSVENAGAVNEAVYITNYTLVTGSEHSRIYGPAIGWRDLESGEARRLGGDDLVYGIPLIVGARKGHPNFNEIAVMSIAEATRKLKVYRSVSNQEPDKIEQQFALKVRTKIQIEARNSYQSANTRPLDLVIRLRVGLQVTNSQVQFPYSDWVTNAGYQYLANIWPGEPIGTEETNSYVLSPLFETNIVDWQTNTLADLGGTTNFWAATLTNRMLFFIVDKGTPGPPRIVDFVTLNRPHNHFQIGRLMSDDLDGVSPSTLARIWSNDKANDMSLGVANQLLISGNSGLVGDNVWGSYDKGSAASKEDAARNFADFWGNKKVGTNQAPFSPTRVMVQANYYQVNDPLVHYTFEDLRDDPSSDKKLNGTVPMNNPKTNFNLSMGVRNPKSLTWNRGVIGQSAQSSLRDPTIRDPGLIHPDYWDFPTNRFPNIGWLGRVHRGTPWQSIYLKSRNTSTSQDWRDHSGNQRDGKSADLMVPRRDWELLSLFTAAPHPNATRGRLSINQTNLAAWSAVLSGAITSEPQDDPDNPGLVIPRYLPVNPSALSPAIEKILIGINHRRTFYNSNQFNPFGQFGRVGDLLSVPELTDESPFLNVDKALFDALDPVGTATISDADYERIPRQILSLLKVGEPRFVVYAWGQSLKPARYGVVPDGQGRPMLQGPSIVTAGDDKGLCINYQITGETATRAVVRVDFDRLNDGSGRLDYRRPHAVVESFNVVPNE